MSRGEPILDLQTRQRFEVAIRLKNDGAVLALYRSPAKARDLSVTADLTCAIIGVMRREHALALLQADTENLRLQFGVKSLALFGSVARDEAGPTSDVDLLVEFDRPTGYFGLVRLEQHLQKILGCTVDLGTPNSLREVLRRRVLQEAVRVA